MKPKWSKIWRWVGGAVGIVLLLVVAMPVWFPWLLAPAAKRVGFHYSRYVRGGFSHFVLETVTYTNAGTRFRAERVQVLVPSVWAWRLLRSNYSQPYVEATNWTVAVAAKTPREPTRSTSTYTNAQRVGAIVAGIGRWLPRAAMTNGWFGIEQRNFKIDGFAWDRGSWSTIAQLSNAPGALHVEGKLTEKGPWHLKARYSPVDLEANLQARASTTNLALTGGIVVQTNQFEVSADFGRDAVWPDRASIRGASFTFPGRMLKLDGYGAVTGGVSVIWSDGRFVSELRAQATPPLSSQYPPLDVALKAHGTLQQAELQQLKIGLPGFQAELSTNVVIPLATGAPPAVLSFTGNLREQPWVPAEGLIRGEVLLSAGTNIVPRAVFDLMGTNIGTSKIRGGSVVLKGNLSWPFLEVTEGLAEMERDSIAELTGMIDLSRKEIRGGEFDFAGTLPAGWLPTQYHVERLSCSATFDGEIDDLRHNGKIQVAGFKTAQLKKLDAELTTSGRGRSVEGQLELRAGNSVIHWSGGVDLAKGTNNLSIKELLLATGGQELLRLQEPVSVGFSSVSNISNKWQLDLPAMTLRGQAREVALQGVVRWPGEGKCAGHIHGIALRDFQDLLTAKWNPIEIQDVAFNAEWQNGPATVTASVAGGYTAEPGFLVAGNIRTGSDGVLVSNLSATSRSAPVVAARGFLPLTINPANPTNIIGWKPAEKIELKAKMEPDPEFWRWIFELTGVEVVRPELNVDLSGSWNSPTGWVHASAERLRPSEARHPVPPIEEFRLDAQFDAQKLRIEELRFLVAKQPVLLTAELPLDASFYDSVARRRLPDWRRGRARLRIQRAPIAAFMRYIPRILTPTGILDVDLAVEGPDQFNGEVLIEGATSSPLGEFGAIRDITNQIVFRGQTASLNSSAKLGGEPVQATGTVDLKDMRWTGGEIPPFQVKLKGERIALARRSEIIIRSDFDLAIDHTKASQPVIAGTVHLRDSFYTSDLASLIPGRLAKASQRPPYFSIEAEPVAEWRLDCTVTGTEFLKVRTPFFQGRVSVNFKLEGTLKEPLASGQATVPKGQVEFPFGTLDVKQGMVSLTAANPFQPEIFLTARARRFGYDITMEVTGTANKPVIQFSSVPSLTSEQILLSLSAGELPRDDISLTPQQRAQRFAVFLAQRFITKLGFAGSSDRLTVRSGEDFTDTGTPTYDIEFKLDKNWSLVGEYDRFNAFNLSVKRRIYSR